MENEKFLRELEYMLSPQELEYMLSPDYDTLTTNQASFEKSEAQVGNFIENAYDLEEQLVKIGMRQHAIVEQEES
ncbi:hypothetical protein A2U01_0084734, partial [Trifolium medium]|nr:hypothetical protein [Trifolium medium]